MSKVWTPAGLQQGPVNSMVGKGETIYNPSSGDTTLITNGTKGVDNQPSSVSPDDDNIILGNDIDWRTGESFANQVAPHTAALEKINKVYKKIASNAERSSLTKLTMEVQKRNFAQTEQQHRQVIEDSANLLKLQHDYTKLNKYNFGKNIPGYDAGKSIVPWYNQAFGMAVPLANTLAQGLYWKNQPLRYHDTYASNPYEGMALSEMAKMRYNPYPIVNASTQKEREAAYANSQMGGLTAGQRNANRIALSLGNMQNAANIYGQAEQMNNQYRSQYAQAAMNAGQADRQARMSANQFGWEDFIKSHGAKVKGIETSMANMNNIWQTMFADRFKINMADKTLGLYNRQISNDENKTKLAWDQYQANLNTLKNNNPNTLIYGYSPWSIPKFTIGYKSPTTFNDYRNLYKS